MKRLWFKNKTYGWGWTPVTWEGWTVTLGYIIILLVLAFTIDENSPPRELWFMFFLPMVVLTITLLLICYKTGEKPEWRRGEKKEK